MCRGTESSLLECSTNPIGLHNCDHSEDAGVKCEGTYCNTQFRFGSRHYITLVSWKNAHGQSTLKVRQRGGWVLFQVLLHLNTKEYVKFLPQICKALVAMFPNFTSKLY